MTDMGGGPADLGLDNHDGAPGQARVRAFARSVLVQAEARGEPPSQPMAAGDGVQAAGYPDLVMPSLASAAPLVARALPVA